MIVENVNESKLIEETTGRKYLKQDIEAALDYPLNYKGIMQRFIHYNPNFKWNSVSRTWTIKDRKGNEEVVAVEVARSKLTLVIKRLKREYVIVRDAQKAGILSNDFNLLKHEIKIEILQRDVADSEIFEFIYNSIKKQVDTNR